MEETTNICIISKEGEKVEIKRKILDFAEGL